MKEWETHQQMKNIICEELEIPEVVNKRIAETLEHIGCGRNEKIVSLRSRKKRGGKGKRAVIAIALALAMIPSVALAAYVSGENSAFYQAIFGNSGRLSVEEKVEYDEDGKMSLNLPNSERVEVDDEQAEALVGAQLTGEVGTYELKSLMGDVTTLEIENMLYDDKTGCYFMYMSLERETGGFPDIEVFETGECYFNGEGLLVGGYYSPGRMYIDEAKSTENKVYLSAVGVNMWKGAVADDEMTMDFIEYIDIAEYIAAKQIAEEDLDDRFYDIEGNLMAEAVIEMASVNLAEIEGALPAKEVLYNSQPAATFSSVGIKLNLPALGFSDSVDGYEIDYVSLEYADGTNYVVMDEQNNISNVDYACAANPQDTPELTDETVLVYCFNRLVDTDQVVELHVNDMVLPVE